MSRFRRSINKAATAATCGAAAEVPKKLGNESSSVLPGTSNPKVVWKNVVLPPSGPMRAGFVRTSAAASGWPPRSNSTGVPPAEEKLSRHAGTQLGRSGLFHARVWYHADAPTASAPAALGCPTMLALPVSYSSTANGAEPRSYHTYLMSPGAGPATHSILSRT